MLRRIIFAGVVALLLVLVIIGPKKVNFSTSVYNVNKIFETAAQISASYVRAGILPVNIVSPEYVAEYFSKLAITENVDTFVIVGKNYFPEADCPITISKSGFETAVGKLDVNLALANQISNASGACFDAKMFGQDFLMDDLSPFIKKISQIRRLSQFYLKTRNI